MHSSLAALFRYRLQQSPEHGAVLFKEGKSPYREMNWRDFGASIYELAFGLAALGLQPQQCAALVANTSHLWILSDLAILAAGGVSVPIYPTSSSGDAEHILRNSGAGIVFVHTEQLLQKLLPVARKVDTVRKIVLLTPPRKKSFSELMTDLGVTDDYVMPLEQVQELGRNLKAQNPSLIDQRIDQIKREDLATIIYTSGTTGTPKGVMLLNSTIMSVIEDLPPLIPVGPADTYLSFLPLSHVFERVCGEFYFILNGARMGFAEGLEHIPKNMAEVEPSMMLVVPRLLDKIYAKVNSGIEGASERAQKLIRWAIDVGRDVVNHQAHGRPIRPGLKAKHWVAEKLVLKKLRQRIGKNIRLIVSGGAPGTPHVIEFFNAIGINVLEGYGLTETAAPTNVNRIGKNKVGSVGPTLPSVEVKIAEDGEILFRGPTIFPGYFQAEEMTQEVFTDGWFHTGDIGNLDKDGYLRITDRKKDLIVNSAGKNIAPQKIEATLKTVPFVSQAVVFGDKRKTLVAILTLEEHAVTEFAREKGWQFNDYEELTKSAQLKRYLKAEIADRSYSLADYEQVRNFAILPHDLSIESGELTATLKIRRNVLAQKYKDIVEKLYREEGALVAR